MKYQHSTLSDFPAICDAATNCANICFFSRLFHLFRVSNTHTPTHAPTNALVTHPFSLCQDTIHTQTHSCIRTDTHTYTHMYTHANTYLCTSTHTNTDIPTHTHIHIHTHLHTSPFTPIKSITDPLPSADYPSLFSLSFSSKIYCRHLFGRTLGAGKLFLAYRYIFKTRY